MKQEKTPSHQIVGNDKLKMLLTKKSPNMSLKKTNPKHLLKKQKKMTVKAVVNNIQPS